MCLEELTNICKNMDLIDENFVERDINLAFNLSQMTEIDEINQDKNSQLQYVEFLEALARIAEKASPAPFGLTNVIHLYRMICLIMSDQNSLYI